MIPSKYQQDIYDFIEYGEGDAVVAAVAGSGKTTTLINGLGKAKGTSVFFAFNKSIIEELGDKLEAYIAKGTVKANTIHSYGFAMLRRAFGKSGRRVELNGRKYSDMFRELYDDKVLVEEHLKGDSDLLKELKANVAELTNLIRINLMHKADNAEIRKVADKFGIQLVNDEVSIAKRLVRIGMADTTVVDFTDMIFLPCVHGKRIKFDTYDFVFVDECQDLNLCQQQIVRSARHESSRSIYVGDPKQAIYGFAGADIESFNRLTSAPNTTELPLSVCYRCGSKIIELAKGIVPYIEAHEGSSEGIVSNDGDVLKDAQSGDMVLCRNVYPLVRMAMKLIISGKKATIKGRSIGEELKSAIVKSKAGSLKSLFAKLKKELDAFVKETARRKDVSEGEVRKSQGYQYKSEKLDVLAAIVDDRGIKSITALLDEISALFDDDSTDGIILSSIHKAKGLEANRVFIIHRELMPSKFAEQDWMKEQESNLMYVAYTRAKKELLFDTKFDAFGSGSGDSIADVDASEAVESDYIAPVGGEANGKYQIAEVREIEGKFGKVNVHKLISESGNIASVIGKGRKYADLIQGATVFISCKVRAHSEFKGIKETSLIVAEITKI